MGSTETLRLRGRDWQLEHVAPSRLPGALGACHFGRRIIRIVRGLTPDDQLEVYLHEALHGCLPDLSEEAVEEIAHDLTAVAWRAIAD